MQISRNVIIKIMPIKMRWNMNWNKNKLNKIFMKNMEFNIKKKGFKQSKSEINNKHTNTKIK